MNNQYGKLCTIIYDLDKPFAGEDEYQLYLSNVKSKDSGILEPMSGSGRFYIPLKELGYRITGFDLSDEMLAACRKKCIEKNLEPDVFRADITVYRSEKRYDCIFIPMGSISVLCDENDLAVSFKNIHESLKENGVFIFSFLNLKSNPEEIDDWTEKMRYSTDEKSPGTEIVCYQKLKFIKELMIMDIKLKYELLIENEIIETEYQDFPLKLHDPLQIENLLESIGFKQIEEITPDQQKSVFSVIKCTGSGAGDEK